LLKYQSRAGFYVVGLRRYAFAILLRICCEISLKLAFLWAARTGVETDFNISQISATSTETCDNQRVNRISRKAAFARIAQIYAVRVSEFVRKRFLRVRRDGNWVGAARKSNNGVTFPINSIFSRAATFESQWVLIVTNP